MLQQQSESESPLKERSIKNYFEGIERAFRPGQPLYGLKLIDRRAVDGETGKERIRRTSSNPEDIVIAYATLLFAANFFPSSDTINAEQLIGVGLTEVLAIKPAEFRGALLRIHQHDDLGQLLSYTQSANLDSIQFRNINDALNKARLHAYSSKSVNWP